MIELLIALTITALVLALTATHFAGATSAWQRSREIEADLAEATRIEAVLNRFAVLAGETLPGDVTITADGQSIRLEEHARLVIEEDTLILETGDERVPVRLEGRGGAEGWRITLEDRAGGRRIDLIEGEERRYSVRIPVDRPLPCRFDAIGRRCIPVGTP